MKTSNPTALLVMHYVVTGITPQGSRKSAKFQTLEFAEAHLKHSFVSGSVWAVNPYHKRSLVKRERAYSADYATYAPTEWEWVPPFGWLRVL